MPICQCEFGPGTYPGITGVPGIIGVPGIGVPGRGVGAREPAWDICGRLEYAGNCPNCMSICGDGLG